MPEAALPPGRLSLLLHRVLRPPLSGYPEQQPPGIPHEPGEPQQAPELEPPESLDGLPTVVWAETSLINSSLPHF